MAFDYGKMQATAARLLDRFAQGAVQLTRVIPGTPDPEAPWEPVVDSTAVYTLDATVRSVQDKFIDGTTILSTDREVTAATFAVEPQPGDTLSIDGTVVSIVKQMRIPSAGTLVCWRFIVRG